MGELLAELARPVHAPAPSQLVRAVDDQAPFHLPPGEPLRARAQVAQEPADGLPRVARAALRQGRLKRRRARRHTPGSREQPLSHGGPSRVNGCGAGDAARPLFSGWQMRGGLNSRR